MSKNIDNLVKIWGELTGLDKREATLELRDFLSCVDCTTITKMDCGDFGLCDLTGFTGLRRWVHLINTEGYEQILKIEAKLAECLSAKGE